MATIATATIQASDLERGDLMLCGDKYREVLATHPSPAVKGMQVVRVSDSGQASKTIRVTADLTLLIRDRAAGDGGRS